jgi:hypothetical protein
MSATVLTREERQKRQVLFEQFLRCLDREENLIHYRLTWGLQWNIASFAALFAIQHTDVPEGAMPWVRVALVVFGISVSILSLIAIQAAHEQTKFLICQLNRRLKIKYHDWDETEFIRPYGNPSSVHRRARRVSAFFPLVFIILWGLVFLYAFPSIIAQFINLPHPAH